MAMKQPGFYMISWVHGLWLVVEPPLEKYEFVSQLGWWNSQYMDKIKNVPNHRPGLSWIDPKAPLDSAQPVRRREAARWTGAWQRTQRHMDPTLDSGDKLVQSRKGHATFLVRINPSNFQGYFTTRVFLWDAVGGLVDWIDARWIRLGYGWYNMVDTPCP